MTDHIARTRLVALAIVGLLLVFGLPQLGIATLLLDGTPLGARIGREVVWIGLAVLLVLWITKVERLPLSSVGLVRPQRGTLGWALVATAALMATVMLTFAVIGPALGLQQNMAATASIVQVPLWLFITTPVVAGVTEELIYRGYAIERLAFITKRRWLAGLIAGAAFLLTHWSWGAMQMIIVAFATVILTCLYLWRRDLICCVLAHVLADLIGFSLARAQM